MVQQEYLPLWNKIESFPFDKETAAVPFSAKLAASENWSAPFTQRTIEEYRKFLFLCCISEKGAAPSQTVDEVWHLHLTYTQSYWIDLCRDTLGKDIHHYPSAGGDQEDDKHREWYKETLELYRAVFAMEPPADIWPAPRQGGPVPVPEDLTYSWDRRATATIAGIIALPFLFIWISYGTPYPFSLNGQQFLLFFPLYGAAIILSYIVYRHQLKKQVVAITAAHFPRDITPFQMAAFLYGKHRAVQAGLVDLIKRDLVELDSNSRFLVKSSNYQPIPGETNPMIPAYAQEPDGSLYTYASILANWYDRAKFGHPVLEALDQFAHHDEPMRAYFYHVGFFAMVVARATQGIVNGRPIIFLVLETVGLSILFYLAQRRFSRPYVVYGAAKRLYKEGLQSPGMEDTSLLPNFALQGVPAINGFAEGAMLAVVFSSYDPIAFRSNLGDGNSSGGSNCGGSSGCSGGSSCGSSCGGGGCGGCGGGGD